MLVRALEDLRKFAVERRPLLEPKRVSVLCSFETGVRNSVIVCKEGAEVENVFLHCVWVGGGSHHHIHSPSPSCRLAAVQFPNLPNPSKPNLEPGFRDQVQQNT